MEQNDDPFAANRSSDRTVFVPTPGGRRRGGAAATPQPPSPASPPSVDFDASSGGWPEGLGPNPLLRAAMPLFALVRELRTVRRHDDIAGLRSDTIEAIRRFDAGARRNGVNARTAGQAAYGLCALIDETVLGTPWGLESIWSKESLLITFYKEYTAGETFFNFLQNAQRSPHEHIDILEFFYVCLSLGFQGRYRLQSGGIDQLTRLRQELYENIRRVRGEPERELSPQWRGVVDSRLKISRFVPLWVVGAAALAIVMLVFLGLSYRLNAESDQVLRRIAQVAPTAQRRPPVLPGPAKHSTFAERLRLTLESEIAKRQVDVEDVEGSIRIVIYNRGLFPSGGVEVGAEFQPLIAKIAAIIKDSPGPFTVIGHTDNVPIHTLRFPSNWHLSRARAQAVATVLTSDLDGTGVVQIEGKADLEPIASNDTKEGRDQNRRVELLIPAG